MTASFIITPDGVESPVGSDHAGAAIDDAGTALAQLDAAIGRSDWASVVKLEPSVGAAIDAAAVPAYGSNVAQAATFAGESQQNTQAAWATNAALGAQVAAGASQTEMSLSAQMISQYLHQALYDAQQALAALSGGGSSSWIPWAAGIGALGGLFLWLTARSRRPSALL
jgi:hypothetical protein